MRDLVWQLAGIELESFVAQHKAHGCGSSGFEAREQRPGTRRWARDEQVGDAFDRSFQRGSRVQAVWKCRLGQVASIDSLTCKLLHVRVIATPEPRRAAGTCELDGKCRSHEPGTEDGNIGWRKVGCRHETRGRPKLLVLGRGGDLGRRLSVQRVEIHRRQQQLREASLADEL